MMIDFDFFSGSMKLDGEGLYLPAMQESDFLGLFKKWNISLYKKKKSRILQVSPNECWASYFVESIGAEFNSGRLRTLSLSLLPNQDDIVETVMDLAATKYIQHDLDISGDMCRKSEVKFEVIWGTVDVQYDVKMSAASLVLKF